MQYEDDWDIYDFEDDDFEDDYDDDEPAYLPCPSCGDDVYEDLEQCPHCGDYITFSSSPWADKSIGWVLLGALGMAAILVSLLFAI